MTSPTRSHPAPAPALPHTLACPRGGGGCVLAAARPIVIFSFLMDYYAAGLTAGATKG